MTARGDADLTAKARIRATAMRLIARKGLQSLSVRETARLAGVSPSLVIHHFGSKHGLADAVSDWLLSELATSVVADDDVVDPFAAHRQRQAKFTRLVVTNPVVGDYLRQMLSEPNTASAAWFRQLVDEASRGLIERKRAQRATGTADTAAEAAMLLVVAIAPILLQQFLQEALDCDFNELSERWNDAERALLGCSLYRPIQSRVFLDSSLESREATT